MGSKLELEERFKLIWEVWRQGWRFSSQGNGPLRVCVSITPWKSSSSTNNYKFLNAVGGAPDTHTPLLVAWFFKVFMIGWKTLRASSGLLDWSLSRLLAHSAERSRLDLLRHDGEDDVLIASPYHRSQRLISLYGGADVTGRGDSLAIDADDDITLQQASSVTKKEEWRLTNITKYILGVMDFHSIALKSHNIPTFSGPSCSSMFHSTQLAFEVNPKVSLFVP